MPDAASVKLVVFDVDGVLTDGSIFVGDTGAEFKRFHVRDGLAIQAATSVGLKVGVISARSTPAVTLRMNELKIENVIQGMRDKGEGLDKLCSRAQVDLEDTAYLGDDLYDLPAMVRCGYPMAVADAAEEVRTAASYVTRAAGGRGAVREAVEHILKAQGLWDAVLERYGI